MSADGSVDNIKSKKTKIVNVFDTGSRFELLIEPYQDTKEEIEVKRNCWKLQMREKHRRDRMANGANILNDEEIEEKNEAKNTETTENKQEDIKKSQNAINYLNESNNIEEKKEREDDEEGSVSSTSTGVTVRSNYSIRAAIDENYIPQSIRNMNYMTIFMFFLLLGLTILYYVLQLSLYSDINDNIKNIEYSEERKYYLMDVNSHLKILLLIDSRFNGSYFSRYYLNLKKKDDPIHIAQANNNIKTAGLLLKESQTQLSLKTSKIGEERLENINPKNIELSYLNSTSLMRSKYNYSIWQTMLEISITSLRLTNVSIDESISNYSSIYFLNTNSLNGILLSLDQSTDEITDVIEDSRKKNMTLYIILLILASVAVSISAFVLLPVIRTVKKSREKVLSLFLLLEDAEVKLYQKNCEKFAYEYRNV